MPLYAFEKENGEIIEQFHPINEIPNEIVLQDGSIAKRKISVPYISGSLNSRIKKQQTQKNIEAGQRGKSYWKKQSKNW